MSFYCLKGVHYKSAFTYRLLTFLKLKTQYHTRHKIAAEYLKGATSVVDICAGEGALKEFLPVDCGYSAVEQSEKFISILRSKDIGVSKINLHNNDITEIIENQSVVMVISLSHFRNSCADRLLETFKNVAERVVIVEDVLQKKRPKHSALQKVMNYLCGEEFDLYTFNEFKAHMESHNYSCLKYNNRYAVGLYGES